MIPNPKIKISKLDAAKRQLETAIRLYFNDADPVSIHTLAGAAHNILSDINKKYGCNPMIVSDFLIKDEFKKEFKNKLNEAKNHFKHADKDPESAIDFAPKINEFYLFDACEKYIELTSENVPHFIIFRLWFWYKHPGIIKYTNNQNEKLKSYFEGFNGNKVEYFSEMLSVSGYLK